VYLSDSNTLVDRPNPRKKSPHKTVPGPEHLTVDHALAPQPSNRTVQAKKRLDGACFERVLASEEPKRNDLV
jgi:hypothetical protein